MDRHWRLVTRSGRRFWLLTCVVGLWLTALVAAGRAAEDEPWPVGPLKVQGTSFRDAHGRQVILNGINLVDKEPKDGFNLAKGPELFARFHAWGFNCVRLGIVWAGVEPEPGKYNEAYLKQVDEAIDWAAQHQVFVLLDMHQDLFGMKYSDGAPDWATLDEGKPHATGAIWSDSYLLSSAVQTAFDNFWANKPAPDGKGVQEHYAAMWQHVARRYADRAVIVGYDLMNEPFPGSTVNQVMPALLMGYGKVVAAKTGKAPTLPELMQTWANEKARVKAMEMMASAENYAQMVDAAKGPNETFETKSLQAMYQRLAEAIRPVDPRHILFLEHSYFSNIGVPCSLQTVKDVAGQPDPQVAYGAHAYDMLTDTQGSGNVQNERMRLVISRIHETSQRTRMPLLLGEWGALAGKDVSLVEPIRQTLTMVEEYRMGNTYWTYSEDLHKFPLFREALSRPLPVCVAGELTQYRFDREKNQLEVAWKEAECDGLPSIIYVPDLKRVKLGATVLEPKPVRTRLLTLPDAPAAYLLVYPAAGDVERKIIIQFSDKTQS